MVKQTTNDFVANIHIIPDGDILTMTTSNTSNTNVPGFMKRLRESEDSSMLREAGITWGSSHPFVDERKRRAYADGFKQYCQEGTGQLRA